MTEQAQYTGRVPFPMGCRPRTSRCWSPRENRSAQAKVSKLAWELSWSAWRSCPLRRCWVPASTSPGRTRPAVRAPSAPVDTAISRTNRWDGVEVAGHRAALKRRRHPGPGAGLRADEHHARSPRVARCRAQGRSTSPEPPTSSSWWGAVAPVPPTMAPAPSRTSCDLSRAGSDGGCHPPEGRESFAAPQTGGT